MHFTARVPDNAPYGAKHLLDVTLLSVVDDATDPQQLPAVDDDAIHVAAYLGDTNGNGRYNAPDTTLIERLDRVDIVELPSFRMIDPQLLADANTNHDIDTGDTGAIRKLIVQMPVSSVPALPAGLSVPAPGGPDPRISIPQNLAAKLGDSVSVPVQLLVTETAGITLCAMDLVIEFDPTRFALQDAQLGNLLQGTDFSDFLSQPAPGRLIFSADAAYGTPLLPFNTLGDIAVFSFLVLPQAQPGPSPINLLEFHKRTSTALFNFDLQELTLVPPPTNAATDSVDGLITVADPAAGAGSPRLLQSLALGRRGPGGQRRR